MSRKAREKSTSGIYHVMLRGINHQQIFEEAEDYDKFLSIVKECKAVSKFELYAYCLMGNHIHLLLKESDEPLEIIMKRLVVRFVYWYNIKYQRVGHLFQDRFKSEPVEDWGYFSTALVYIHQNPVKARICKRVEDYAYSSYGCYAYEDGVIDVSYALKHWSYEEFVRKNHREIAAKCMDIEAVPRRGYTDEQAKVLIKKIAECESASDFQRLEIKKRDRFVEKLKEKGLSIRQISRLTGVSFNIVRKL